MQVQVGTAARPARPSLRRAAAPDRPSRCRLRCRRPVRAAPSEGYARSWRRKRRSDPGGSDRNSSYGKTVVHQVMRNWALFPASFWRYTQIPLYSGPIFEPGSPTCPHIRYMWKKYGFDMNKKKGPACQPRIHMPHPPPCFHAALLVPTREIAAPLLMRATHCCDHLRPANPHAHPPLGGGGRRGGACMQRGAWRWQPREVSQKRRRTDGVAFTAAEVGVSCSWEAGRCVQWSEICAYPSTHHPCTSRARCGVRMKLLRLHPLSEAPFFCMRDSGVWVLFRFICSLSCRQSDSM